MKPSPYRIREVDGAEEDVADWIETLHRITASFPDIPPKALLEGFWWLVFFGSTPVAFAGMIKSTHVQRAGYFIRVGVEDKHRGNGLQLRLMRCLERRARARGWSQIISDTTEATHSANNFIRSGYRLFDPAHPWAFPHSLYWKKDL